MVLLDIRCELLTEETFFLPQYYSSGSVFITSLFPAAPFRYALQGKLGIEEVVIPQQSPNRERIGTFLLPL